jgi:hypothetical protein
MRPKTRAYVTAAGWLRISFGPQQLMCSDMVVWSVRWWSQKSTTTQGRERARKARVLTIVQVPESWLPCECLPHCSTHAQRITTGSCSELSSLVGTQQQALDAGGLLQPVARHRL